MNVAPIENEAGYSEPIHRTFSPTPFLPDAAQSESFSADAFAIQCNGLAHRWEHTQAQTMVIGISGGLDSTLALLVAVQTADLLGYDRQRIVGVTMPGFGTSDRTYQNAIRLMRLLGIQQKEIDIREQVTRHLEDIGHSGEKDITYENAQARIRTLILMDLANQMNGLVLGTGDMSELALGWMTYAGDQISMYGINAGIPKTMVRFQIRYAATYLFGEEIAAILLDIIDTPISPELLPTSEDGQIAQFTEDKIGPYELHDFFMYHFLRYGFTTEKVTYMAAIAFEDTYSEEEIQHWIGVFRHRFYTQQFKRSCMPDGPKVIGISLSPRGDWRMPSDVNEMPGE